jgi:hypothetical protein
MVDDIINAECKYGSDTCLIKTHASLYQNILLPDSDGNIEIKAVFNKMTVHDSLTLDRLSYSKQDNDNISSIDYTVYRSLLLRRCLISLDENVFERKNGWIVEEDWNKIKNYNAMILNHIMYEFEMTTVLTEEEESQIERQSVALFGTDAGKVNNPNPSISMYCTLLSVWDKFGLNIETLKSMKNSDYLKIREIMSKEAEINKRNSKK